MKRVTQISFLSCLLGGWLLSARTNAQGFANNIKFSSGTTPALSGSRFEILPSDGQRAGSNLFHSFSDFSVAKDFSAVFKTPADVANVLARVAGGNVSEIDGTLRTELETSGGLSGANLYLINPSGIVFGPNAKLEVGGAFTATTADHVKLADGGRFDARTPANDVLTTAPVSAFGFVTATPGSVSFSGTHFTVGQNAGISVVAGAVRLDGAKLEAPSGRLTLRATGGTGDVPADGTVPLVEEPAVAVVELRNGSAARIDGFGGGRLTIRSGTLRLEGNSSLSAVNSGDARGGDIDVWAGTVSLLGGSRISAAAQSSGRGGDIIVKASGDITVDGDDAIDHASIISTRSASGTAGDAGNVSVQTSSLLRLTNGGSIEAVTFSSGRGGNVALEAGSLLIANTTDLGVAGINTSTQPGATGSSGNLQINVTGALSLTNGGTISAGTFSTGNGGRIDLHAGSLSIDGSAAPTLVTGIVDEAEPGSRGDAGNMRIAVDRRLSITGTGEISAETLGHGRGGNITIAARSIQLTDGGIVLSGVEDSGHGGSVSVSASRILIDEQGSDSFTGITTQVDAGSGDAGDIRIRVGTLTLNAGLVSSDTYGAGHAGNIHINAGLIRFGTRVGAISSDSVDAGNGGNIFISAGTLLMAGGYSGGYISTSGFFGADAGDINITANQLFIFGNSSIESDTYDAGRAGNVTVRANNLVVDGTGAPIKIGAGSYAYIESATSDAGPAGKVTIQAGNLTLRNGGLIGAETVDSGRGGDVDVRASTVLIDGMNSFSDTGVFVSAAPGATTGRAGSLRLSADTLTIRGGGLLSAETTSTSAGGNLSVQAQQVLIDGSGATGRTGISAQSLNPYPSATGGSIQIDAGTITIEGGADGFGGIFAGSFGAAAAGSVTLRGDILALGAGGAITSANTGTGAAGSVTLLLHDSVYLDEQAVISTSATFGDAGTIVIDAGSSLDMQPGSTILASAGANGGTISLSASELISLDHSSVIATAGTTLTATTANGSAGAGGNITIDPRRLIFDHSLLSANAALGRGGNITLAADFFFRSDSPITATGAQAGTVLIAAPALDLANGLVALSGSLIDASTQLRDQCARKLQQDFSSYLRLGRGGQQEQPEEMGAGF